MGSNSSAVQIVWDTCKTAFPWLSGIILCRYVLLHFTRGEQFWFPCSYLGMLLLLHVLLLRATAGGYQFRAVWHWCFRSVARKYFLLGHCLLGILLFSCWKRCSLGLDLWCVLPWLLLWHRQRARQPRVGEVVKLLLLIALILFCLFSVIAQYFTLQTWIGDFSSRRLNPNPLAWLPQALTSSLPIYRGYQFQLQFIAIHVVFLLSYFLLGGQRFLVNVASSVGEQADTPQGIGNSAVPSRYVAGIVALVVLLLVITGLYPGWPLNPVGNADFWGYFGECVDFVHLRIGLPSHPAGDLLPFHLYSHFFYMIFTPVVANYVNKISATLLTAYCLYDTFYREFNFRTAFTTSMIFLIYPVTLAAFGHDYPDGRVIMCLAMTMNCISRSASAASFRSCWLTLAGVCFALLVSTAFLGSIYAPVLYLWIIGLWRKAKRTISFPAVVMPIVGFLAGIMLLCCIHYSYTGVFIYFANTLQKARHIAGQNRLFGWPVTRGIFSSFALLPLLLIAYFPFVYVVRRFLLRQRLAFPWLYFLPNALAYALLLALQVVQHQETIRNICYFDHATPLVMLALAAVIHPFINRISRNAYLVLTLLYIAASLKAYTPDPTSIAFGFFPIVPGINTYALLLFLVFTIAELLLWIFHYRQNTTALLTMVVILTQLVWSTLYLPINAVFLNPNSTSASVCSKTVAFNATVDWVRFIDQIDPRREAYLWYNSADAQAGTLCVSFSAASHLWQGRVLNEAFPKLDIPIGEVGIVKVDKLLDENIPLLIYTTQPSELDEAQHRLGEKHLAFRVDRQYRFTSNHISFGVYKGYIIQRKTTP